MTETAADFLAETLEHAGVSRIYGVVGDSLNGVTDSLRRRGRIDWVHVRHEEAAAFAAGAEAQLTGQPGGLRRQLRAGQPAPDQRAVRLPAQPARRCWRSPRIFRRSEIGIDYFQATHPEILFQGCSHYVELVSNPKQLPQILQRAMRVAVARRGVAVVVMPGRRGAAAARGEAAPRWVAAGTPAVVPPAGGDRPSWPRC